MDDICIPFDSKYLCLHFSAAAVYGLAALLFGVSIWQKWVVAAISCSVILVVGPVVYYPITYFAFWRIEPDEAKFIQLLRDMWGPLWAALSAGWLLLLKELPPW